MGKCTVEGCTRDARANGMCVAHYKQHQRHPRRKPTPVRPRLEEAVRLGTVRVSPECARALDATGAESRTAAARQWLEARARATVPACEPTAPTHEPTEPNPPASSPRTRGFGHRSRN